jgi:hypothetical protein
MPLTTSAGGHLYRLDAYVQLYGPTYLTIQTSDYDSVVSVPLQTGDYTAYLYSYSLSRDDGTGNFLPVSATLVSNYAQQFTIYNQATSTISYQFETDGQIVTVGTGQLDVKFGVTETAPACTVLGSDCGDGAWCAPPELTGQPLSCLLAGATPLGQSCASPTECVANASCFDFGTGQGPVCAALCTAAEFGATCDGGGTCTKAGTAYGVCVGGGSLPNGSGGAGSGGKPGFGGEAGAFAFGGSGF